MVDQQLHLRTCAAIAIETEFAQPFIRPGVEGHADRAGPKGVDGFFEAPEMRLIPQPGQGEVAADAQVADQPEVLRPGARRAGWTLTSPDVSTAASCDPPADAMPLDRYKAGPADARGFPPAGEDHPF